MLPYRATLLWSGRWESNPLSTKATDLQSAPALQLRRSPIINEGNIRQHLLRFALQVWQENDLNLLSLRLIPFLKHGFVLTVRCQQQSTGLLDLFSGVSCLLRLPHCHIFATGWNRTSTSAIDQGGFEPQRQLPYSANFSLLLHNNCSRQESNLFFLLSRRFTNHHLSI